MWSIKFVINRQEDGRWSVSQISIDISAMHHLILGALSSGSELYKTNSVFNWSQLEPVISAFMSLDLLEVVCPPLLNSSTFQLLSAELQNHFPQTTTLIRRKESRSESTQRCVLHTAFIGSTPH